MTILIGADAGGTKTHVTVMRGERVLAQATGGAGAVRAGKALQAGARITRAVRDALTSAGLLEADVLVVGAAGVGRDPERSELREALRNERLAGEVLVTGDLDIALEAAFGSAPGIVLVSGTGSVAVARAPDGTPHRAGGYGWQMGDEGSGYAIGQAALTALGHTRDGRAKAAELTRRLLAGPPARTFDEMVRWTTSADPREVAALAPAVFAAAAGGDAVAATIVAKAADDLAALAESLLRHFEGHTPVPLALTGGNVDPGRPLRDPVIERLQRRGQFAIREAALEPVQGALAMAARLRPG
jgi:N-acetylglucosamine kinase-like BadF-type ATPase